MKIPNTVKIDGMNYTIKLTNETIMNEDYKVLLGRINYNLCEIVLDGNANEQTIKATLMHEIVHGIMKERNIDMQTEEETFIDEIAKGFYNLLNDNPDMFSNKTESDEDNIGISDALANCIEPIFKIKP